MAKWPKLVPSIVCNTPITVQLQEGVEDDGSPKYTVAWEGKCNYSEKSRQVLDEKRQLVELQARVLIDGDIAPGQDIAGEVMITPEGSPGVVRCIYSASRARNPDGTVNFTQLELM